MQEQTQRRLRWSLILGYAICTLTLLALTIGYLISPPAGAVSKLEEAVSRIPLGIDVIDADVLMGSPPDEVVPTRGVMMNSATMLSEDNSLAPNFGPPQDYSLRTWKDKRSGATVVVDKESKVVGHWGWTDRD